MQNNVVKAFRQRLVRFGFTDISIYDEGNGYYRVYCTSSNNKRFNECLSLIDMRALPRHVFFSYDE